MVTNMVFGLSHHNSAESEALAYYTTSDASSSIRHWSKVLLALNSRVGKSDQVHFSAWVHGSNPVRVSFFVNLLNKLENFSEVWCLIVLCSSNKKNA